MTSLPSGSVTFLFTMIEHRPPSRVEQASIACDLAVLRASVPGAEFESLWIEGSKMTQEHAIALAMEM